MNIWVKLLILYDKITFLWTYWNINNEYSPTWRSICLQSSAYIFKTIFIIKKNSRALYFREFMKYITLKFSECWRMIKSFFLISLYVENKMKGTSCQPYGGSKIILKKVMLEIVSLTWDWDHVWYWGCLANLRLECSAYIWWDNPPYENFRFLSSYVNGVSSYLFFLNFSFVVVHF